MGPSTMQLIGVCVIWFFAGYLFAMGIVRKRELDEAKNCMSEAKDLMLDLRRKNKEVDERIRAIIRKGGER